MEEGAGEGVLITSTPPAAAAAAAGVWTSGVFALL
jgi:hypothetical protein